MIVEPVARHASVDEPAIEELSARLLALGGQESVRVIEAIAAVHANQRLIGSKSATGLSEAALPYRAGPCQGEGASRCDAAQPGICRRIARRALRGSLIDPTGGAIAFHRIDDNPGWARDRLPIAYVGRFLFYGP